MIKKINDLLRRRGLTLLVLVACVMATLYWIAIASSRYVSDAHVIIQRTDLPSGQVADFSTLLAGVSNSNRADQLLLRDHLLSVDMLRKLDGALNLRAHFSDSSHDFLSRMWFEDASIEWFHRYFLKRVQVEFDDYSGVLIIKAQAYDPKMAQRITALLVQEGERFMNQLAQQLVHAQVGFLEQQVVVLGARVSQSRRAVLDFQNAKGLLSPQASAESIASIVARLEAQRSEWQTQRAALLAYLVANHPSIVILNQQINAIERQIAQEQGKLTAPNGKSLNRTLEEFQRLEAEAIFAQDVYKTALAALERGRLEAMRIVKMMSVLQQPTLPEYPIEPRRYYNTLVFILVTLLLAAVVRLLLAIVHDHTD